MDGVSPTDIDRFDRARQARDARFDGLFYIAVRTTRIYCRPICPAPAAKPENIRYYATAAAAAAASGDGLQLLKPTPC